MQGKKKKKKKPTQKQINQPKNKPKKKKSQKIHNLSVQPPLEEDSECSAGGLNKCNTFF